MLRRLVGLVGGLGVLFSVSTAQAQCSKDTDCKGDRVCDAGSCVTPPSPLPPPPEAPSEAVQPQESPVAPAPEPLPEPPAPERPKLRRQSTGMMVGGIVMVSIAPVALLVAAVNNNEQTRCERGGTSFDFGDGEYESFAGVDCSSYDSKIYGGLIAAAVLAGVGVPFIVIGGKKVPAEATATITPWATPSAAGIGLRLTL